MCTEPESPERPDNEAASGSSGGDGSQDLLDNRVTVVLDVRGDDIGVSVECKRGEYLSILESDVFRTYSGTSKLDCIDNLIMWISSRIESAKAVKDRLEREFIVEFERSKK